MSFKLTALMLDHGPKDPLAKLIAMCLCDRANDKNICWPSRADIMSRTGASNSTITRKLRMLMVQGYIQTQQRKDTSNIFRINALKLHEAEAKAQHDQKTQIPMGFEPFEEEMAAVTDTPQAFENIGDGHSDLGDGHSDLGDGHSGHVTYQKPINEPSDNQKQKAKREKRQAGRASAPKDAPCRGEDFTEDQRMALKVANDIHEPMADRKKAQAWLVGQGVNIPAIKPLGMANGERA